MFESTPIMKPLAIVPQPQSFRISKRPLPAEGCRIRIDAAGRAHVEAEDDAGRFYANVTLGQLEGVKGPLEIEDWPAYSWLKSYGAARTAGLRRFSPSVGGRRRVGQIIPTMKMLAYKSALCNNIVSPEL